MGLPLVVTNDLHYVREEQSRPTTSCCASIFASILPDIDATGLQILIGVTAIVLANAAISLAAARRGGFGLESAAARYAALLATNLGLVYLANALLGERRDFDLGYGLFFAFLITTIIWLYDAFRPVYDVRFATPRTR